MASMPLRLHSERVTAAGATPSRWLFVLHGVFGSGKNWRSFMRAVAAACPDWGFLLVDQRGHGDSFSGLEPPHDLDAMAEDLVGMEAATGLPLVGVVGHSLGGKVALAYAAKRAGALEQVWVLDARPGTRDGSDASPTAVVLRLLESLPARFDDRRAFTAAVQADGQPRAVAAWLAMNVRRDGDGDYRLRLDLPAIRAILDDYFSRDLWGEVERQDPQRELHVVVAGRSFVWRDGDRQRLVAIAAKRTGVQVHHIPEAGHWLHVDAPDALRALMISRLAGTE